MYEDLKGKTALVTGAGKKNGIGLAIAANLASSGCHLILADLGSEGQDGGVVAAGSADEMTKNASDLASRFDIRVTSVSVDVTSNDSIAKMVTAVSSAVERIDILCNNAGAVFGVPNAVHTYPEADWMKTIDVNLHSVFRVSRALLPLMFGQPAVIINTASRGGKVPPLFNGAYAVAKAGVIMLTKVMAKELAGAGIRVNAVCPGQIHTDLEDWRAPLEAEFQGQTVEERNEAVRRTIPLNRVGTPDEVGRLVAFLASEASAYITGQAINITGGQLMEL
ncbi:MAG: SDR family NAD(P)-dependent oxidoreductase [Desulfobacterales bacterium]|nr:SDR family NAD(P)-dependent oxidoreductase [Desulfobacterales bacterium]